MFGVDGAFVFEDLRLAGVLTTVTVDRLTATGRNARGRQVETRAPVGAEIEVYITTGAQQALAHNSLGERARGELVAVMPPCSDVRPEDQVVCVSGHRRGVRFRVLDVEGDGPAPVIVTLEQMRGDA